MTKSRFDWRKMAMVVICPVVICMMFLGCKKDPTTDGDNPNTTGTEQEANIVSFTFDGIDGVATIDKTKHTVIVKAKETVDLTTLVVTFTLSTNATAKVGSTTQVSGQTANNFATPVSYSVTSGDGKTTNNWTVTVIGGKPFWSSDVDVYVAGAKNVDGKTVPMLWKNGVPQNLPIGRERGEALSVFVSGSDVYVVGSDWSQNGGSINGQTALLWKNGVRQSLSSGTTFSEARSVFVSGSDVYVVGDASGGSGTGAKLWKNGVAQTNLSGGSSATAKSIFVLGSDVYVAGNTLSQTGKVAATLWKNEVAQVISTKVTSATSVFVLGNDVYVAGYDNTNNTTPKLWKNGVEQSISGSSEAKSVFVSGTDVYVAGWSGTSGLWKNGVAQNKIDGVGCSVYVLGNDVYVAGYKNGTAVLWKNGIKQDLDGTTANSVFVVKK